WCKLFGDLNAKHHWAKSVTDHAAFTARLLARTGLTTQEFEAYRLEVRAYRDKFIAHLDELNNFVVPKLQPAQQSVVCLYQYLSENEDDVNALWDAPANANTFYRE